jgi:pimeloyl-ACP methyl ester carboxylesterase
VAAVQTPRLLTAFTRALELGSTSLEINGSYREGTGVPLVFLHGFGSTKDDYADVIHQPALAAHPVLAYDAPGCGASRCSDPSAVTVPLLVEVAEAVVDSHGIDQCHLVGHSMGGLTALLFADRQPQRVRSFIDIEGNLAPEDCFLSRQILRHSSGDPAQFLHEFGDRVMTSDHYSGALYAAGLPAKVRPEVVRPIFESMVALSDHGDLLQRFLTLPMLRMFVHGEDNAELSYLPLLAERGVTVAQIPRSGHWPMYSNAPRMWDAIIDFLAQSSDH